MTKNHFSILTLLFLILIACNSNDFGGYNEEDLAGGSYLDEKPKTAGLEMQNMRMMVFGLKVFLPTVLLLQNIKI
jgi:hypothetical protein